MDDIEHLEDTGEFPVPQQNEPTHRLATLCPHCKAVYPNETVMQCSRCGHQRMIEGTQPVKEPEP